MLIKGKGENADPISQALGGAGGESRAVDSAASSTATPRSVLLLSEPSRSRRGSRLRVRWPVPGTRPTFASR